MAKIVERALGGATVKRADTIAGAFRVLETESGIQVVVSGYRLDDGTARKLFSFVRRRWPKARRIVYAESADAAGSKWPNGLVHEIVTDFEALKKAAR